jgi:5-methylcytosine-specific restriction endonuclease McrBC GTP-binding regulatory subunit McrB
MSYEDFVEGIKPEVKNGQIVYSVKPGIFKSLCEKAAQDNNNAYVLIIDEINRGNVSQIFGELITLLEDGKRLGNDEELKVKMPYSQTEFGVPNNLYIIGTMNTADRSVEALDSALRRRFCFKEMMPNPELLTQEIDGIKLKEVLGNINKRIVVLKDREHQIGHSYFMKVKDAASLKMVFKNNIIPLLQEYFYGNCDYIRLVLGDSFMEGNDTIELACQSETDVEQPQYRLLTEKEWEDLNIIDSINNSLLKSNNKHNQENS